MCEVQNCRHDCNRTVQNADKLFLLNVSLFLYMQCKMYWVLAIAFCTLTGYVLSVDGCGAKMLLAHLLVFHSFLFKFVLHLYDRTMFTCVSLCLYRRYIAMYICEMLIHFHSGSDFTFHKQILSCYFIIILMFSQCPHPLFAWQLSHFNFLQNTLSQLIHFLCRLQMFGEGHFADWMENSIIKVLVLYHKDFFLV